MKLDIGRGKILGTKKVSPNGQVSGFKEYAGQDVLVVLPAVDTDVRHDGREVIDEIKLATQEHMRVAFREYGDLKRRFTGPNDAARHFMAARGPRSFRGLYESVEAWVRDQVAAREGRHGIDVPPEDGHAVRTGPTDQESTENEA